MSSPILEQYDDSVTARSLLSRVGIADLTKLPGVTEVAVNRPFEAWTESSAGWKRHELPEASLDLLTKYAHALTIYNKAVPALGVDDPEKPVVLPDGERGQIVIPPMCEPGTVSMTIRIPSARRFSVRQLAQSGHLSDFRVVTDRSAADDRPPSAPLQTPGLEMAGFEHVEPMLAAPAVVTLARFELEMLEALRDRDIERFLTLATKNRLNIVLVGGTGSGKTTLMKGLADLVPCHERIATIEDTHEVPLPMQPNHVHLFYSDRIPARRAVKATLRMKFDRVYLAELRGDETWDYLRLLNTGQPGGITTIHANDAISALTQVATLVKQSPVGQTLDWEFLMQLVKTTVDIVLFMERGTRRLTQVYYDPVTKWKLLRGLV